MNHDTPRSRRGPVPTRPAASAAGWLLPVIYLAFVSLGLPDGVFGVCWPAMRGDLGAPLAAAGVVSLLVGGSSAVSSVASGRVAALVGTGWVVLLSCLATGLSLVGFAFAPGFAALLGFAIPLGLGAGAVDACLNHDVAVHYGPRHVSWLHGAWGIGATTGPAILVASLSAGSGWRSGYLVLALVQLGVAGLLALALPLWRRRAEGHDGEGVAQPVAATPAGDRFGPALGAVSFGLYVGVEFAVGLWAASLLVDGRGLAPSSAGLSAAGFFLGMTGGRFLLGAFAARVGSRRLVRLGLAVGGLGVVLLAGGLPGGLVLMGIGFAPIYPMLMHETPRRFSPQVARFAVGLQVGAGYLGAPLLPALLGVLAERAGLEVLPVCWLLLLGAVAVATEALNRLTPHASTTRRDADAV